MSNRETETQGDKEVERQTVSNRETDKEKERETGRETVSNRETKRKTDRERAIDTEHLVLGRCGQAALRSRGRNNKFGGDFLLFSQRLITTLLVQGGRASSLPSVHMGRTGRGTVGPADAGEAAGVLGARPPIPAPRPP